MKKKTASSNGLITFLGAKIADLAATAYFLIGPKGKEHRKYAKAWAIKMKGDVVEKLEAAREVAEPAYREIIDSVAEEYAKEKKAGRQEVDSLAKDLKNHWKTISKSAQEVKKEVVKDAARLAKKVRF